MIVAHPHLSAASPLAMNMHLHQSSPPTVGFAKRCQYYFIWGISEAAMNASGFGFNGFKDPEKKVAKFDRYMNADILSVRPPFIHLCLPSIHLRPPYIHLCLPSIHLRQPFIPLPHHVIMNCCTPGVQSALLHPSSGCASFLCPSSHLISASEQRLLVAGWWSGHARVAGGPFSWEQQRVLACMCSSGWCPVRCEH
jgi:hypothetical protein